MKLSEEGIVELEGGGTYAAAESLYPDAKSFCEAVIEFIKEGGEIFGLGDLDYLIDHTGIAFAHHCIAYLKGGRNDRRTWWQIEDEPGRGRSPVWLCDLND
jgi:hypothetical protein